MLRTVHPFRPFFLSSIVVAAAFRFRGPTRSLAMPGAVKVCVLPSPSPSHHHLPFPPFGRFRTAGLLELINCGRFLSSHFYYFTLAARPTTEKGREGAPVWPPWNPGRSSSC
uniref:Putative secreted protein n=1 Tax=Anopheles darlingi TaxID=43151 RepID=A0A2M4DA53_ANODA